MKKITYLTPLYFDEQSYLDGRERYPLNLAKAVANRIEGHFWAINEFVVKNADYRDWGTVAKAMAEHIRYRNGPHRDQRLVIAERRLLVAA